MSVLGDINIELEVIVTALQKRYECLKERSLIWMTFEPADHELTRCLETQLTKDINQRICAKIIANSFIEGSICE